MRYRWVPVVLLGLLFLGAKGCPTPAPTPTPPPIPDPAPICQPGATCGCWHHPPGEQWQKLPDCPPPVTPPPATGCAVDEATLIVVEGVGPAMTKAVTDAMKPLGDTTGKPPAQTLEALAAGVRAGSACAVAGQEAVFVRRPDSRWDEYHAVYFGTGALIPGGKWMAAHREPGPPPVTSLCGEPVPPPLVDFNLHCGNRWCDATPILYGCDFCAAIGLGEMPGLPGVKRCNCPAGNEDNGPKRMACERQVIGGAALWRSSTGVEVDPGNHLQARCSSACSWIEVCKADGTKCSRVTQ